MVVIWFINDMSKMGKGYKKPAQYRPATYHKGPMQSGLIPGVFQVLRIF